MSSSSTLDLDTGLVLERFEYDTQGRLAGIIDQVGNRTSIERNPAGTAILSPFGQRTTLDIDGKLTAITSPDVSTHRFDYRD